MELRSNDGGPTDQKVSDDELSCIFKPLGIIGDKFDH
jgi:hypothetical protein